MPSSASSPRRSKPFSAAGTAPRPSPPTPLRPSRRAPSGGAVGRLGEVPEHVAAGLVVHLGLEGVLLAQRGDPGGGGPGGDLVVQAPDVREAPPGVVAHDEWHHPGPAPGCHVDDGVARPEDVAALGETSVEDAVMALGLEQVAGERVGHLLGREMLEVHRLAGERADAGGDEHQPGQHLAARRRRALGQELAGLLGEVEEDGVAVEHRRVVVDDRRHLGVRVDGEVVRPELLAAPRVDRHRLVRHAGFLEEKRNLHRVGREIVEELDHRRSFVGCRIKDARRPQRKPSCRPRPPAAFRPRTRAIPRAFPGKDLRTVKERGEQDARDRLSIYRMPAHLASRAAVLDQGPPFLSAVGSPYRTWPVRAFGPYTGQTRRPSPDPLPAFRRPRRSTGRSDQTGVVPNTQGTPELALASRARGSRDPGRRRRSHPTLTTPRESVPRWTGWLAYRTSFQDCQGLISEKGPAG